MRLGWWLGSQAAGVASQDSTITDFRIEGKGRAEGSATTGSETGSSNGRVLLRAGVRGAPAVLLSVTAQATASNLLPDSNTASAEYTFQIDIGDEDRDGLLDAWEDEGIDVDNDGTPEIDLPAFGADPRHKDVFVELDAMTGAAVDPQAIGMVEGAFDRAPAALIDNPDGQAGVSLHVDIDETSVPHQALSGGSWPSAFDTIESQHFGSATDRACPDWELVKTARQRVYRYCLWADTLALSRASARRSGRAHDPLGDSNFEDGAARDPSSIPIELDPDTTAFIRSLAVVDYSTVPEPSGTAAGMLAVAVLAARSARRPPAVSANPEASG